ncbi:hypothetical protein [Bradyrhizobium lablabi]|uniref:hypothetical protein n=1 Tax=Bradyrhizobium lablabi TaxID=722472 RepID=UPI0032E39717
MGDAVLGAQKHPDHKLVVARRPLGPNANRKRTYAEGEVPDPEMGQRTAKFSASELHHVDMGALDRPMKTFETIEVAAVDRKKPAHCLSDPSLHRKLVSLLVATKCGAMMLLQGFSPT